MKMTMAILLSLAGLLANAQAAEGVAAPMTEKERLDILIKQNRLLTEENLKLRAQSERPKTKEEAFALCMQAAKGNDSAMAAESIGEHCDKLLGK